MENIVLEKINFVNGKDQGPAIKAETLNQMQQNTENAINELGNMLQNKDAEFDETLQGLQEDTTDNINDLIATKQFIENSMKTMETEGTSIHVSDSADYGCNLKVEGKSEQIQTEQGKNLLDLEELNSSTETWIVSAKKLTLTLKPNTQYTCSSNVPAPTDVSVDGATDKPLYFNGNSWNGGAGVCLGKSRTATTDENGNLFIAVALNRTYSEELLNGTYYIQIEEGATATEFEAFVPDSPSPNYRSEIENAEGDLEVKVVGKNLFNKNDIKAAVYLDVNGAEQSSAYWDTSNYMDIEAGNKLTYQGISQVGGFGYNAFYDKDKNFISSFKSVVGGTTVNIPENAKYVRFCFVRAVNDIQTFQLELGETATNYEAYKEQTVTFPLGEQKLMKDGYLGDDGIHNKRKQVVLTGNETWNTDTTRKVFYTTLENSYSSNIQNSTGRSLCNFYKEYGSTLWNDTDLEIECGYLINYGSFYIRDVTFTTVEELKACLAEQYSAGTPLVIEYELDEEETTAYTSTQETAYNTLQKFKTYRTTTNISNNQDTNMQLTYKMDLQTQIAGGGSSA